MHRYYQLKDCTGDRGKGERDGGDSGGQREGDKHLKIVLPATTIHTQKKKK